MITCRWPVGIEGLISRFAVPGCPQRLLSKLVVAVMALCCATSIASAQLHTAGQYIVDNDGNRVRINAANWYGAESTDFVVAGLQVAPLQSIVQQIKGLGFNAVRLPWSNELYETNPLVGSYALTANPAMQGENALTILDQVVSALTNAGIMVILDNHNSNAEWCCSNDDGNTLWYNSQYPETSWISDWEGMAQRYQNNPLVIGADLRNEPRGDVTWGENSATDWHAAAERGGNAVLSVNPSMLIFVEGINYATDLSSAATMPIQLNVANQLVYSAHDYGFNYTGLTTYTNYVDSITPRWGYLASGSNPQPLWIGEFGTCNTANSCVTSSNSSDNGLWFGFLTTYLQEYELDWSYWAINGTQSTGNGRTYGAIEGYGVLNTSWNGSALPALSSQLATLIHASPGFTLVSSGSIFVGSPGQTGASTVTILPQNGFTGTITLSCSVGGGPSGAAELPTCTVPASENITGSSPVTAKVSIATSGSGSASRRNPLGSVWRETGEATLCCVLIMVIPARRRRMFLPVMIGMVAILLSGCGSSSDGSTSATTSGTYTITVTGTASGLTPVTAQLSVSVQ